MLARTDCYTVVLVFLLHFVVVLVVVRMHLCRTEKTKSGGGDLYDLDLMWDLQRDDNYYDNDNFARALN